MMDDCSPMKVPTSLLRISWVAAYVTLITLAVFALPVTCYCGDQVPGPHALVVAADRAQALDPTFDYGALLSPQDVHNLDEQPHVREMPTTFEIGLGAIAVISIIGAALTLPRPAAPIGIVRFLFGFLCAPTTPPPRFSPIAG